MPKQPSPTTLLSNILQDQLDQYDFKELHPYIIHLKNERFHILSASNGDAMTEAFGRFILGVTRLASMTLEADKAIICLPCQKKSNGRLSISGSLKLGTTAGPAKYIALSDNGDKVDAQVFGVIGEPGKPLLVMPDEFRPNPSYFTILMKAWGIEAAAEGGVLQEGDTDGMEIDADSLVWQDIDLLPPAH